MIKLEDGSEVEIASIIDVFEMVMKGTPMANELNLTRSTCPCGCGELGYISQGTNALFKGFKLGIDFIRTQNVTVATLTPELREALDKAVMDGVKPDSDTKH